MEALFEFFGFLITKLTEVPGFSGAFLLYLITAAYIGVQLVLSLLATNFDAINSSGDVPLSKVLILYQLTLLAAALAILGGFVLYPFPSHNVSPYFTNLVAYAGLACIMKTSTITQRVEKFVALNNYEGVYG